MLDSYFKHHMYPFTKHHLDGFHDMFKTHIPNTIKSYNPITMLKQDEAGKEIVRVDVSVGANGIYVDRPTLLDEDGKAVLMTPQEARLRNLTYATKLYADISIDFYKNGEEQPFATREFPYTIIGRIPIMLHSDQCILHNQGDKVLQSLGECPMDPGGYFIVDGKEKVIVAQERITTNRIFVTKLEKDKYFSYRGYIHCTGTKGETALSPRSVEFTLVKFIEPEISLGDEEVAKKGKDKDKETDDKKDVTDNSNLSKVQGAIMISLPGVHGRLPLTTVFRAFGIVSDKAIVEAICGPIGQVPLAFMNFLRPSLAHRGPIDSKGVMHDVYTTEEAHDVMKERVFYKSVEHLKSIMATDVFPNIEGGLSNKAKYLAYLTSVFMRVSLNLLPESDRDGFVYKRINISGILLSQLFQETYMKFRNAVRDRLDQEYHYKWRGMDVNEMSDMVHSKNLYQIFQADIITDTFVRSLKGMWGPPVADPDLGIVQDLSRLSYIGFLSHLRRVNNDLDRSIKITSPHRLHSQQWGLICPFETPDGASVGYLKNFALMTQVTFGTDPAEVVRAFRTTPDSTRPLSMISESTLASPETVKLFINGALYGICTDPPLLTRSLRLYRRNGKLDAFISIAWNIRENEIRINTDAGRPCRPLFIVENGKPLATPESINGKTWPILMGMHAADTDDIDKLSRTQCVLEYLDIEEENTMLIAMKSEDVVKSQFYTHMEIHPSTVLSVVTSIVPFANHNQGPRVYFHGSQSKQAIGVYATNWHRRFDTSGYIQHYPQRRLVGTRGSHYVGNDRMPNGCNVIVAIMTHTGFNQEDSIMINRRSIDRGLFQVTSFKTVTATEKVLSDTEKIMFTNPLNLRDSGNPVEGLDRKNANFSLINDDGIVLEESYIPRGQRAVVVGMVHVEDKRVKVQRGVFTDSAIKTFYKDVSLLTDINHYGTVDRVFVGTTVPGNPERVCKVRFRKVRRPEPGDKHCSMHAQKGVVGMILEEENMPFTKDGIRPDIIINPHAIPTRMTIGHLIEMVFSKLCCMDGVIGDGTVFVPFERESVFEGLSAHGMDSHGNEVLYDGRTGKQLETNIFMGPIYYYRLKHMVVDKMQSRGTGSKMQLTHQPTAGRSQGGGLRIGEMERDVLIGHGAALFLKECMMEKSDKYQWAVCRHCGGAAIYNPKKRLAGCDACKSTNIAVINTPYSFRLLIQELETLGVQLRISVDKFHNSDNSDSDSDSDSDSSSNSGSSSSDINQNGGDEPDEEEPPPPPIEAYEEEPPPPPETVDGVAQPVTPVAVDGVAQLQPTVTPVAVDGVAQLPPIVAAVAPVTAVAPVAGVAQVAQVAPVTAVAPVAGVAPVAAQPVAQPAAGVAPVAAQPVAQPAAGVAQPVAQPAAVAGVGVAPSTEEFTGGEVKQINIVGGWGDKREERKGGENDGYWGGADALDGDEDFFN